MDPIATLLIRFLNWEPLCHHITLNLFTFPYLATSTLLQTPLTPCLVSYVGQVLLSPISTSPLPRFCLHSIFQHSSVHLAPNWALLHPLLFTLFTLPSLLSPDGESQPERSTIPSHPHPTAAAQPVEFLQQSVFILLWNVTWTSFDVMNSWSWLWHLLVRIIRHRKSLPLLKWEKKGVKIPHH